MSRLWGTDRPAPGAELPASTIIAGAEAVTNRLIRILPRDGPLLEVATSVVETARKAQVRIRHLASPFGLPRIRLYLVLLFVGMLGWWIYGSYVAIQPVQVAVTGGESAILEEMITRNGARGDVKTVLGVGSPDNRDMVLQGLADIAVIQGGVPFPTDSLTVLGTLPSREHVLFFTRGDFQPREGSSRVITYNPGQGSEILGEVFFRLWDYPVPAWAYVWEGLADGSYSITDADSAVFVVIDPGDERMQLAIRRVAEKGFVLQDPYIGVRAIGFPFLERLQIEEGYYLPGPPTIPGADFSTYGVDGYIVARPDLTERQQSAALVAFGLQQEAPISVGTVLHSPGSSVMEDLSIALEAVVNLVVILAALFGVEILLHRRYLHELNNLISRISLLQAHHNLFGERDQDEVRHSSLYLDGCADLLGIISTVIAYYGQKNASLVFSGLTGQLHARANDLKINIRLKLLHAEWVTPEPQEGQS